MKDVIKCSGCGALIDRTYYTGAYGCIEEEYMHCDRCGYIFAICYSKPIVGFISDRKRGFKNKDGKWIGKNIRMRKRIRRKHGIKLSNQSRYLDLI